ncbi:MAG TPA: hypothetical protein VFH90_04015 [Candidatus Limnocylindria bacterium]|nr:hypothetical protein [Candidatus Limnocylindria bacterium]
MSKKSIARLFWASVTLFVAGIVLAFAAAWLAFASDAFVMDGPDVVGIKGNGWALAMVVTGGVALLAVVAGAVGGLVSWIGALLNTAQLTDKTWFVLLLVLGLFSFGLVAMIAYLIAGPDGTAGEVTAPGPATT